MIKFSNELLFRHAARVFIKCPQIVTLVYLITLSWIPVIFLSDTYGLTPSFREEWFSTDSKHEAETDAWLAYRNDEPWDQQYMVVLVQGKGTYEGADMATEETLAKLEQLLGLWFTLNVTISNGRTFDIWDLCYRGPALLDFQNASFGNGPLYLPCLSISLLECFHEQKQFLHQGSYFKLDSDLGLVERVLNMPLKPYSLRPSYKDKTPQEIKAILTNSSDGPAGCPWYLQNVLFPLFTLLLGHSENSNGQLYKAPYLFTAQFYDGPQRMAFRRLGTTYPEGLPRSLQQEMDDFREARGLHMNRFYTSVVEFSKASPHVEFSVLLPLDEELAMAQAETIQFPVLRTLIIIFLNFSLMAVLLDTNEPLHSHCLIANVYLILNIFVVMSAYGVFLHQKQMLSCLTATVMPTVLLAMGMGDTSVFLDELFHLNFDLLRETTSTLIYEGILVRVGPHLTLTALVRAGIFAMGCLSPIPGVRNLCILLLIWTVAHYILSMVTISFLVFLETLRIKYVLPEPVCLCCETGFCCTCCPASSRCSSFYKVKQRDRTWMRHLSKPHTRVFLRYPIHTGISILGFILLALSIVCIMLSRTSPAVEFPILGMLEIGSYRSQTFQTFFKSFCNFQSYLVFWNVEVPIYQKDMIQLYDALTQHDGIGPDISPPFLSSFYSTWGIGIDGFFNTSSWKHPAYAPLGIASTNEDLFYKNYNAWNAPVLVNMSLYENMTTSLTEANAVPDCSNDLVNSVYTCENNSRGVRSFAFADLAYVNEFSYHPTELTETLQSKLYLSFIKFWIQVATSSSEPTVNLDVFTDTHNIISKHHAFQDSQVFVKGLYYDLGNAYLQSRLANYRQIIPVSVAVIFISAASLLWSLQFGLLILGVSVLTWAETVGLFLCIFPSSIAFAVFEIIALALATDHVVHFIFVFSRSTGDVLQDRLMETLQLTGISATMACCGMLTTAIILLSADISLVRFHFSFPLLMLTIFSVANTYIFVPSLLMTMENIPCIRSKSHREVTV